MGGWFDWLCSVFHRPLGVPAKARPIALLNVTLTASFDLTPRLAAAAAVPACLAAANRVPAALSD